MQPPRSTRNTAFGEQHVQGEKQIEIDRRRARERLGRLKHQLSQIAKDHSVQRNARKHELKVALVGYTNSGKTTLMNALTRSEFESRDALFATLDATVRTIDPRTRPKILLSDTVGFIRNLPHRLVESFKSTLDEVLEADLLCLVIDVSHERYRDQLETTEQVLQEIGAADKSKLYVFNKVDLLEGSDPLFTKIIRARYKPSISVSAYRPDDVMKLREKVYAFFEKDFERVKLMIPIEDKDVLSLIYRTSIVFDADYSFGSHVCVDVKIPHHVANRVSEYRVNP